MTTGYEELTEAQWRTVVVDLARNYGWRAYYVEQSTREIQTRTRGRIRVRNVNMGGQGYPDLTLVRGRDRRLIFAELKREPAHGRTTRSASGARVITTGEQNEWLTDLRRVADGVEDVVGERDGLLIDMHGLDNGDQAALRAELARENHASPRLEVYVWKPSDYNDVERILR